MERILIIGCGGSGKSTLARQLGERLKLPVVHLDKLFWHSGWVESTREEIDGKIAAEIAKDQWILDGNYTRTLPMRLQRCDTVIFLCFSRFACLRGVLKRVLTNYGKVRPDMGEGCPERFDWEFLRWVWDFPKNQQPKILKHLSQMGEGTVVILKNRRAVKAFLERL